MRILLIVVVCCALTSDAFGQTRKAYERAGDEARKAGDYYTAMEHYGAVLSKDENRTAVWYKYAECARMFHAFPEAEKAYLKVAASPQAVDRYPELPLGLAEVKRSVGQYPEALQYLSTYLENPDAGYPDKARSLMQAIYWVMNEADSTRLPSVRQLDRKINSEYSDFAGVMRGDTLFFSSYRFDWKGKRERTKRKITKLMMSVNGARAREPRRGFPDSDSTHVAHSAFSPDGNFLFFTQCTNIGPGSIRCAIYLTVRNLRGRWDKPQRLPEPVNLPGYTTTQPQVAFDSSLQSLVLWFASDRPGGAGQLDLWWMPLDTAFFCPCNRPPANRQFHLPVFPEPVNAREVNTLHNEITPFFYAPERTLYYSSDQWAGFGGYDVYRYSFTGDTLQRAENAGPGINSSYNDLYFFLDQDGRNGLLSSNRTGSFYLDPANKACCNDLYAFTLPEKPNDDQPPVDTLPSIPTPEAPEHEVAPPTPEIMLRDFVGLPLYFDNDEPDKRTRRTTTRKDYAETAQAYLDRQAEYRESFAGGLEGKAREEAENAIDDFFDQEVRAGFDRLQGLCELLASRLESGETIEVIIKGFTSPRAESDYNLNLGKRRISSVRNHFETFDGGRLRLYLESGRLRISEASFGETRASKGISDKIDDLRNSVYHPEAARERRVEIVEIIEKGE